VVAQYSVQATETVFRVVAPQRSASAPAAATKALAFLSPRGFGAFNRKTNEKNEAATAPASGDDTSNKKLSGLSGRRRRAKGVGARSNLPLIRLHELQASGLRDMDVLGGSDPCAPPRAAEPSHLITLAPSLLLTPSHPPHPQLLRLLHQPSGPLH
jgi:hypothetical protein